MNYNWKQHVVTRWYKCSKNCWQYNGNRKNISSVSRNEMFVKIKFQRVYLHTQCIINFEYLFFYITFKFKFEIKNSNIPKITPRINQSII